MVKNKNILLNMAQKTTEIQTNFQKRYNLVSLFIDSEINYENFLGSVVYKTRKHIVSIKFIENEMVLIEIDINKFIALRERLKNNILPVRKTIKYSDMTSLVIYLYTNDLMEEIQIDRVIKLLTSKTNSYDLYQKILQKRVKAASF